MPYISKEARAEIANGRSPNTPGELNYIVTKAICAYVRNYGKINYQVINDVVGALDGAKAEFQRRVVGDYENLRMSENGDVYNE